ncbi:MAG: LemA family protein [Alphaproteobacteria bacterium]|nr:LemA family protein [Alphaproteobacteria bacterium]
MKKLVIFGVVLVVFLMGFWGVGLVNRCIRLNENTDFQWSEIANQYQRRSDLIPNLVEVVKGYAAHEKNTLNEVVEARSKATQIQVDVNDSQSVKQFLAAQGELSGALGRLIAISENYPALKANENFLALQSQLEGTENRIAVARQDYNNAVRQFNNHIRVIPNRWIIPLFTDFEPREMLSIDEATAKVPSVSFQ